MLGSVLPSDGAHTTGPIPVNVSAGVAVGPARTTLRKAFGAIGRQSLPPLPANSEAPGTTAVDRNLAACRRQTRDATSSPSPLPPPPTALVGMTTTPPIPRPHQPQPRQATHDP